MKLEIGKRYVDAVGQLIGPLTENISDCADVYPFWCPFTKRSYMRDGTYYEFRKSSKDLVKEVPAQTATIAVPVLLIASRDIQAGEIVTAGVNATEYVKR